MKVIYLKKNISLIILIFLSGFISCNLKRKQKEFWSESESPQLIGKKVINDLLSRHKIMMYQTQHLNTVHYAEACAGMGAIRLACLLNDTALLSKLGVRYQNLLIHADTLPANHVDANVIGILPLELFLCKGDKNNLQQGIKFANKQWDNPMPNGLTNQTRFWIDDIYMIGSLQVQAYKATGNIIYIERAAMEIDAYLQKLQQPNGLFFHGKNAPFFWGRGNGWVAAGLAEMISVLPPDNQHYQSLVDGYKKMMQALLQYQRPDGMWKQLIDKEESWDESSATAMFGYAIKTGVDKGLLDKKKYEKAYQNAWLSIVKHINNKGKLINICVGTGQSTDINYYLNRPKIIGDLHGQAPVMWFAYSLLTDNY